MGTHPLETAIADYRHWMTQLAAEQPWSEETVLATLRSRDRTQYLIDQLADSYHDVVIAPQIWLELANTDADLGRQSERLGTVPPLADWRKSVHPPDHHWWWFPPDPESPKEALGWLWGGLTIALLTISFALAQDVASRFTASAPGIWSSLGAIVPVVLTLFASGGALTQVGQQALETLVLSFGPARQNWAKLKFFLALALATGLFLFHSLGLPRIAAIYNQQGQDHYKTGDWASAQTNFQQALNLMPDYPEAQFRMGVMYEEFQQFDSARSEYMRAMQAGYLPAYNNLARLYLRQDNPNEAVTLLRMALSSPTLSDQEPELQYALYKNLGQARLDQGRLPEAETALLEAITIGASLDPPRPDAYCLLAQVIEAQEADPNAMPSPSPSGGVPPLPTATEAWTQCLQLANRPEYDAWEGMARQALTQPAPIPPSEPPNAN